MNRLTDEEREFLFRYGTPVFVVATVVLWTLILAGYR